MAGLFLVDQAGKLTALTQSPYLTEGLLQGYLEDYPDLLAGDQMGVAPRKWLFVAREAPVPDMEGGSGRWSLDHLFLDQDATLTFVEVKRATDSRIRREVVGQMLDYAANGLRYWPVEAIQGFLARGGTSADQRLQEAFGTEVDTAGYWQLLRENISEGRIRLLFVADRIPDELLSIVEFLNTHMDHTDVLAVEIPQFTGEGLTTLIPRVLGLTQASIQQKASAPRVSRTWDEQTYFSRMSENPQDEVAFVRRFYDWMGGQGWKVVFGRGAVDGSFKGSFKVAGKECVFPVVCYTFGMMEFNLAYLEKPFDADEKRRELVRRLNMIPGADFTEDTSGPGNKYPRRPFAILVGEGGFEALTDAILWYKAEVEKAILSFEG